MSDRSSQGENMIPLVRMRGRSGDNQMLRKSNDKRRGQQEVFSDEEIEDLNISPTSSQIRQTYETRVPAADAKRNNKVSFSLPPSQEFPDEPDEVEQELDLFSKAIHISNIDEIDHVGLMRGMHERFQRKQMKWQRYASSYSKWSFAINFVILITQIVQMLFHQLVEVFNNSSSTAHENENSPFVRSTLYGSYGMPDAETQRIIFNVSTLRAVRCVLSAITAVLAGFQMKLKLTEKSEKYRRGAKVYARLHRLSTYYLMLAENGGKVEDVTGLWRDAMKKEGKWIPVVKTFMAT